MRGTSQRSLSVVQKRHAPAFDAAGDGASAWGGQLFAVLDALDSSRALLRRLADPARSGDDKAGLVRGLLGDAFDSTVVDVVADLVKERWTADADLAEAIEILAVSALLSAARQRDALSLVENELFTLMRSLIGSSEARAALAGPQVTVESRLALLNAVLGGQGDSVTRTLAQRATSHPRGRRFVATLTWYMDLAADMRARLVGLVTTGAEFSDEQRARLGALLAQAYGKTVQLNFVVDPTVMGGLRINVGNDVVDATVLTRMADARRRMAS